MKSLKELQDQIFVRSNFNGSFTIIQYWKGIQIKTRQSTNTQAYDRILADIPERSNKYGYTLKEAYLTFYKEIRNAK